MKAYSNSEKTSNTSLTMFPAARNLPVDTTFEKMKPEGLLFIVGTLSEDSGEAKTLADFLRPDLKVYSGLILVFFSSDYAKKFRANISVLYGRDRIGSLVVHDSSITNMSKCVNKESFYDLSPLINTDLSVACNTSPNLRGKLMLSELENYLDVSRIPIIIYGTTNGNVLELNDNSVEPSGPKVKPEGLKLVVNILRESSKLGESLKTGVSLIFDSEASALNFRTKLYAIARAEEEHVKFALPLHMFYSEYKNIDTYQNAQTIFDLEPQTNSVVSEISLKFPEWRGKAMLSALENFFDISEIPTITYDHYGKKVLERDDKLPKITPAIITPVGLRHMLCTITEISGKGSGEFVTGVTLVFDNEANALEFRNTFYIATQQRSLKMTRSYITEIDGIKNANTFFDLKHVLNTRAYHQSTESPGLEGDLILAELDKFVDILGVSVIACDPDNQQVISRTEYRHSRGAACN